MRADRLLSLLMLLQIRGQITARELAERLEVSERTIYRDIEALSMAGVPVYAERGPGGGCMLAEGYRTSLTGLTEPEVRSLFMPGSSRPLADLGISSALEAALLKLLAALPSAHQRNVEHTRQRLYLDGVGWYYNNEGVQFLQTLREAIWHDQRVQLVYRKHNGEISERIVDPLGLVAKAGLWYMVALSHGELRVFRISRVRHAEIIDELSERPVGFDLESYWHQWCSDFQARMPSYEVKVRVAPDFVPILPQLVGEWIHNQIENAPTDQHGWFLLTLHFEVPEQARSMMLGCGTQVEVLEPLELRQELGAFAYSVVDFYKKNAPTD